ncbi:hypothetical protein F8M41_023895 [Gigaspora margarita]|uniref:MD-2-related lipid-recognition domain-containing protein n=1 Tax=Gigaspora margarita TaxID=4874 RepID=A0A8H4ACK8_GIGMA|nr:hypothetical protein F8M41_023895 [Gigaspora margarita]
MKNFIFTFILFTFLLTVNAAQFQLNKRAITFQVCSPDFTSEFVNATIGTDPPKAGNPESFNVSGTLTKCNITKGQTFLRIGYTDFSIKPIGDYYVQNFTDNFKVGTPFMISASNVPTPQQLPGQYIIVVDVGDPTRDPNKPVIFGCAFAVIGGSSEEFFDIYKLI